MKLYSRQEIEARTPPLKDLSFSYWASQAQIKMFKKRIIKNRTTFFYTPFAVRKLEACLRKRKPQLFSKKAKGARS